MATLILSLIILFTVLLLRRKVDLSLVMLLNALLLAVVFQVNPGKAALFIIKALLDKEIILMAGALVLILAFSSLLENSGRTSRFLEALSHLFKDLRLVVAFVPAMIGLVPIVAGAIISAPLIVKAADILGLSPTKRTFLNYWFRHPFEFALPTYPGVIISAGILKCSMNQITAANLPLMLAMILIGLTYGFYGVSPKGTEDSAEVTSQGKLAWKAFQNIWPLVAALFVTLAFEVHLFYSMAAAGVYLILRDKPEKKVLKNIALDPHTLKMVYLVIGIISFKGMLEGTDMVNLLGREFTMFGIPAFLIIVLLPFIVGIISGIVMAYVGVTFPILLPYFISNGSIDWGYFSLAYAAGYLGVLLSPVHLCLSTTIAYFGSSLPQMYRQLAIPVSFVALTALLLVAVR